MRRIFYFDLLRCIAAFAVVCIHVVGPYRPLVGQIPDSDWLIAIGINSVNRWAVPVFLLISGALLLGDERPFHFEYYVKRRLFKVVIPFVVWSVLYAGLAGFSTEGIHFDIMKKALLAMTDEATYYHLGFFYYFIPLCFIAPIFQWLIYRFGETWLWGYVGLWLLSTTAFLFHIDGIWSTSLWLYSGYFPLGYLLAYQLDSRPLMAWCFALFALIAISLTAYEVIQLSLSNGEYRIGRWLSYKTINTVMAAAGIFVFVRYMADFLPESFKKSISFISRFSLGIYLLHPLFLWPMYTFGWYFGHFSFIIPASVIISYIGALMLSSVLSRSKVTKWILP